MKIAVCGAAHGNYKEKILQKAKDIGRELEKNNVTLVTGACPGYSNEAVKGAAENNGEILGVSPAKDEKDHVENWKYPTEHFDEIDYTGLGTPARNFPLVMNSDAIIVIGGQSGSMIEFGIALQKGKPIGVLKDSGGITNILKEIAEICSDSSERERMVYEDDPKKLVEALINKINS